METQPENELLNRRNLKIVLFVILGIVGLILLQPLLLLAAVAISLTLSFLIMIVKNMLILAFLLAIPGGIIYYFWLQRQRGRLL